MLMKGKLKPNLRGSVENVEKELECQPALNIDPQSACKINPPFGMVEVVPVANRGDPGGFV